MLDLPSAPPSDSKETDSVKSNEEDRSGMNWSNSKHNDVVGIEEETTTLAISEHPWSETTTLHPDEPSTIF